MAGVFVAITVISSEVKRSREICLRRAPGQQQSGGLLLGQTHGINGTAVNGVLEDCTVKVRPSARTLIYPCRPRAGGGPGFFTPVMPGLTQHLLRCLDCARHDSA